MVAVVSIGDIKSTATRASVIGFFFIGAVSWAISIINAIIVSDDLSCTTQIAFAPAITTIASSFPFRPMVIITINRDAAAAFKKRVAMDTINISGVALIDAGGFAVILCRATTMVASSRNIYNIFSIAASTSISGSAHSITSGLFDYYAIIKRVSFDGKYIITIGAYNTMRCIISG